jgi:Swi5-dependent recombination DNA repair protein 1
VKARSDTAAKMREMEADLEVVRQAARIERRSEAKRPGEDIDAELRELTERWRLASRQAAEDVYDLIRARVEGMGGAKAWRESMKRQQEFFRGMNDAEEAEAREKSKRKREENYEQGCYEEDDGCDVDQLRDAERDEDEDGKGSRDHGDSGEESVRSSCMHLHPSHWLRTFFANTEQGFTMLMMLKSLNIDPDILGYDPAEDKWRDQ